jgi:transposase
VSMTNPADRVEIITSVQRRRRWTASEKVRIVEETFEPGMTVSLVARRHGVAPNQLFTWRRLVAQGALTAAGSGEEVVPASDYRALQSQVRELQRLLGKKTLEAEILKEAFEHVTGSKKRCGCRRRRRRTHGAAFDEVAAAKTMIDRTEERMGLKRECLAADTAYGIGRFLAWVIDKALHLISQFGIRAGATMAALTRKI